MIKRDSSLDTIAGIMTIYMIYIHICPWVGISPLPHVGKFLFFFMAWFFYKSGMFFHNISFSECYKKGIQRLMIPYIIFSIIGWFMFFIRDVIKQEITEQYFINSLRQILHEGAVAGNAPLWFLFTLFCVRIIFYLVHKLKQYSVIPICFFGILAYILNFWHIKDYYWISNICSGMFFFGCGYILKNVQYNKYLFIISVITYIGIIIYIPTFVDFRSNTFTKGNYIAWILSSLAGIITFNNIFKYIPVRFKLLNNIGKDSMSYYVTHWIILSITYVLFFEFIEQEEKKIWFILYLVFLILLLPLANVLFKTKKLRWTLGISVKQKS
ncbi:MAG: acyltransferase family protein [Phocaeicola plebeius]|uniref:acyltransferase family protein n=1 Tax=Phocaeicola plebeius TaxID=310297 RepID=UPI00241FD3EB|nr:acyltransferase family protein [Phocaeicola plebeius]MBS5539363.1 acyltransferase family protein [Phocaeicola plebeius]